MIYLVAGTRPNFMKIAPLRRELETRGHRVHLVHTGQHYEHPITGTEGTSVIVGTDPVLVARETDCILAGEGKRGTVPQGWDGHAATRIVDALELFLAGSPPARAQYPIA